MTVSRKPTHLPQINVTENHTLCLEQNLELGYKQKTANKLSIYQYLHILIIAHKRHKPCT